MPLQVRAPTQAALPYDRIMYVLDVSGSMKTQLEEAIRVTGTFASDSYKVSVVTFNETHECWEGVREPCRHPEDEACGENCLESGWAWMPIHHPELMAHLGSFKGNGGTNPTSALDYAFKHAPARTLIVFISDGDFCVERQNDEQEQEAPRAGPLAAVRAAQAWRRQQNLAPVQMLVWAPNEVDSQRESLVSLAALGGGGLWRPATTQNGPR